MTIKLDGLFGTISKYREFKKAKLSTTAFSFDSSFEESLKADKDAIKKAINDVQSGAETKDNALANYFGNASDSAKKYFEQIEDVSKINVADSVRDFTKQAKSNQLALAAQDKSWANTKSLINGYNENLKNVGMTQEDYTNAIRQFNPQLADYLSNTKQGEATFGGFCKSLIASKAATLGLEVATMALNAVISALLSLAISAAIKAIDYLIHRTEKLIEKGNEAADTMRSIQDDIKSTTETVEDSGQRFAELAKGVDLLTGKNISLSTEDYKEFLEISNKLAEALPNLPRIYDKNGNAIVSLTGNVEMVTSALNALLKTERELANQKIAEQLPDMYKGAKAESDQIKSDIHDLELQLSVLKSADFSDGFQSFSNQADARRMYSLLAEKIGRENLAFIPQPSIGVYSIKVDYDENELKNVIAELKNDIQKEITLNDTSEGQTWSNVLQGLSSWLFTDNSFSSLSENALSAFQNVINGLDIGALDFSNIKKLKSFISGDLLKLFSKNESLFTLYVNAETKFNSNAIPVGEYIKELDAINAIVNDIQGEEVKQKIRVALDLEEDNDIQKQYNAIQSKIKGLGDDGQAWLDSLSANDLKIAYELSLDESSANWDLETWKAKIESQLEIKPTIEIDTDKFISGIKAIEDGVTSLTSAMESLQEGTALSASELLKLAQEYPELLEQANLFADGTVEGQKAALQAILEGKETEYNATIDTYLNELKVTKQALEDQLKLEQQKNDKIVEIKKLASGDVAKNQSELVNKLSEYNDLEGRNTVALENGKLKAVSQALTNQGAAEAEFHNKSTDEVWIPQAETISKAYTEAFRTVQINFNRLMTALGNASKVDKEHPFFDRFEELARGFLSFSKSFVDFYSDAAVINPYAIMSYANSPDILASSIPGWVSEQKAAIAERTRQVNVELKNIDNAIANLESLRSMGLSVFKSSGTQSSSGSSGSSGSGSSGSGSDATKEIEEYIVDVEKYRDLLYALAQAKNKVAEAESEVEDTDDLQERIELRRKLIPLYEAEAKAEQALLTKRKADIAATSKELQKLGFAIQYDADTNALYVENLEHINELTADSVGAYESIDEATNAYRKDTEELINSLTKLNDENVTSQENIYSLAQSVKDAKSSIISDIQEMVTTASDLLGEVQDVYSALSSAAATYKESGYLSIETMQTILDLGTKYLSYLYDEDGQIKFNEESVRKLVAAKADDLAVSQALTLVNLAQEYTGDEKALRSLLDATYDTTDATWGLVYSKISSLDIEDEYKDMLTDQVNMIKELAQSTKNYQSIGANGKLSDYYSDVDSSLESILDYTKELIKYEKDKQIEALDDELERYQGIVDAKKEALQLTRDENNYEEELTDKNKDIAELRTRLSLLSLDDSREAQAERVKLEEELFDLEKERTDLQNDYAYDKTVDALDKSVELFESAIDKRKQAIEDSISSEEKLYQEATKRIESGWSTLYDEIIQWNYEAGSSLESEITEAWESASFAVMKYGSYLEAVKEIQDSMSDGIGSDNTIAGDDMENEIKDIVFKMMDNDINRGGRGNEYWATRLSQLLNRNVSYDKDNGRWMVGDDDLYTLFGSVASDASGLGDINGDGRVNSADARLALRAAARLEELDEDQKRRGDINGDGKVNSADARTILRVAAKLEELPTYSPISLDSYFADKGISVSSIDLSTLTPRVTAAMGSNLSNLSTPVTYDSSVNIPNVNVDVHINGDVGSEAIVEKYGDIIGERVISSITGAFNKSGIKTSLKTTFAR